ncbi:MAG: hypothetical protein AB1646_06805 [Thermodesulfobacteriota bacterium]
MTTDHTICAICAWRATCNKKFSVDGTTTTKCPEFTRDITLKAPPEDDKTDKPKQRNT